jgi:hypothetical protein
MAEQTNRRHWAMIPTTSTMQIGIDVVLPFTPTEKES